MCSPAEYWVRVKRIPLFFDQDADDGEAALFRNQNGQPVRITKPETLETDEKREAAISYYESVYTVRQN